MITTLRNFFSSIPWVKKRFELSALLIGFILLFGFQTQRLDLLTYDLIINKFNFETTNHTVLIEIDDKSLAYLGLWPWSRDVHAELLKAIQPYNTKAIGFDILFSQNKNSNIEQDKLFAQAIEQAGNVVLPVSPRKDNLNGVPELLPQASLVKNISKLGHVDFEIDSDGIIRRSYLYAGFQRSIWPAFGLALTQVAYPSDFNDNNFITTGDNWVRRDQVFVNFSLPQGKSQLTRLSYIDVLQGNFKTTDLYNKIVLVGMNATAMGDQFATPLSHNHQTMPGVEINAHLVNSLINNTVIHTVSKTQFQVVTAILVFLSILIYSFNSTSRLLTTFILLVACSLSLSTFMLLRMHLWFPPILVVSLQLLLYALFSLLKTNALHQTINSLSKKITNDSVTNLPNEVALIEHIDKLITISKAVQLQLITFELTKFKGIGDLLGQDASTQILNIIKQRALSVLPPNAYLVRCNNAEFSVCLPYVLSPEEVKELCDEITDSLSPSYTVGQHGFNLPVYIGVCSYPSDGDTAQKLRSASLSALNRAMEHKTNTTCFYSADIKQKLKQRSKIESDLSKALGNNEIEIYYQPQVSSKDNSIIGAEALLRWRHPVHGLISPDYFIPIAESTGLILEIGKWVLEQACLQAKNWQSQGHPDFRIAVNLSSKQFTSDHLFDYVFDALNDAKLNPNSLELELTESCVVEEFDQALATMKKLKDFGVNLSIDDFGTGYSSLSYLKNFPMDRIKIDRSFINEISNDKDSQGITKAIIAMARSLKMGVIAEGIESIDQLSFLTKHEVEELQGFYFGKPTTAENMEVMLKDGIIKN